MSVFSDLSDDVRTGGPAPQAWAELVVQALAVAGASLCVVDAHHPGRLVEVAHAGSCLLTGASLLWPGDWPRDVVCVSDARTHDLWKDHPAVAGSAGLGAWAAVGILDGEGQVAGVLLALGSQPQPWSGTQRDMLLRMGRLVGLEWQLQAQAQAVARQHQALEQAHGWLQESAAQDPLTQVANRRAVMAFLSKSLALAQRERQPLAVLLMDVKRFSQINALHGDGVGDLALVELAARLAACARGSELVGRMSGDEFMAVLYPCTLEQARRAADRYAAAVGGAPLRSVQDPSGAPLAVSLAVVACAVEPATGACEADALALAGPDALYLQAARALDAAKKGV